MTIEMFIGTAALIVGVVNTYSIVSLARAVNNNSGSIQDLCDVAENHTTNIVALSRKVG